MRRTKRASLGTVNRVAGEPLPYRLPNVAVYSFLVLRLYFCTLMKKSAKAGRPVGKIRKKQTAKSGDLAPVFCALRSLLQPYQGQLFAQTDQPTHFCLESKTPTLKPAHVLCWSPPG